MYQYKFSVVLSLARSLRRAAEVVNARGATGTIGLTAARRPRARTERLSSIVGAGLEDRLEGLCLSSELGACLAINDARVVLANVLAFVDDCMEM